MEERGGLNRGWTPDHQAVYPALDARSWSRFENLRSNLPLRHHRFIWTGALSPPGTPLFYYMGITIDTSGAPKTGHLVHHQVGSRARQRQKSLAVAGPPPTPEALLQEVPRSLAAVETVEAKARSRTAVAVEAVQSSQLSRSELTANEAVRWTSFKKLAAEFELSPEEVETWQPRLGPSATRPEEVEEAKVLARKADEQRAGLSPEFQMPDPVHLRPRKLGGRGRGKKWHKGVRFVRAVTDPKSPAQQRRRHKRAEEAEKATAIRTFRVGGGFEASDHARLADLRATYPGDQEQVTVVACLLGTGPGPTALHRALGSDNLEFTLPLGVGPEVDWRRGLRQGQPGEPHGQGSGLEAWEKRQRGLAVQAESRGAGLPGRTWPATREEVEPYLAERETAGRREEAGVLLDQAKAIKAVARATEAWAAVYEEEGALRARLWLAADAYGPEFTAPLAAILADHYRALAEKASAIPAGPASFEVRGRGLLGGATPGWGAEQQARALELTALLDLLEVAATGLDETWFLATLLSPEGPGTDGDWDPARRGLLVAAVAYFSKVVQFGEASRRLLRSFAAGPQEGDSAKEGAAAFTAQIEGLLDLAEACSGLLSAYREALAVVLEDSPPAAGTEDAQALTEARELLDRVEAHLQAVSAAWVVYLVKLGYSDPESGSLSAFPEAAVAQFLEARARAAAYLAAFKADADSYARDFTKKLTGWDIGPGGRHR